MMNDLEKLKKELKKRFVSNKRLEMQQYIVEDANYFKGMCDAYSITIWIIDRLLSGKEI